MTIVLLRRIIPSRWTQSPGPSVPATLIQDTKELDARGNGLSFWRFDTSREKWENDAILALIGSSVSVEALFVVPLSEDVVTKLGIEILVTPAKCKLCESLSSHHRDAVVDARKLVALAEAMAEKVRAQTDVLEWRRDQVLTVLDEADRCRRPGMLNFSNWPSGFKTALTEHRAPPTPASE